MNKYVFNKINNVSITEITIEMLNDDELSLLYTFTKYCEAMTTKNIEILNKLVSNDKIFTHMSGKIQTKDEYFNDIKNGKLKYFNIRIENPKIKINEQNGIISCTSVLNANAYGAKGIFKIDNNYYFKKIDNQWIIVNS